MDLYILAATRVEYAYYHGLFGLDYWNEIQETCCRSGNETLENRCDFPLIFSNHTMKPQNHNKRCALLVSPYILHSVDKIDRYYIYNSCNYTGKINIFINISTKIKKYYFINRRLSCESFLPKTSL